MKELLSELIGSLTFLVGLVVVVVALVLLLLLVLLNRARDAARYAQLETANDRPASVPTEGGSQPLGVLDLRSSPSEGEMREAALRALNLLAQAEPGRDSRYQIPWFLSLGQTSAGKTTLLGNTGLKPPFGEPEPTSRTCLWWLYDRALVLDVSGDLVLRLDGATSDAPSWKALLELVRKVRRRRPIDGAILALPLPQLLAYDPGKPATATALAHQAELLRGKLEEVRRIFGMEFPVYTVVTQCDRIPGFADFLAGLEPGEAEQMFGWSVRMAPSVAYSDAWVDDAFGSVLSALDRAQIRSLQGMRPYAAPRAYLALPAAIAALREPVRVVWGQIFGGGTLDEALPVRGLYFLGGEGFENQGVELHPPALGYRSFERGAESGRHARVRFLSDLFSRKILFEWSLAQPVGHVVRRGKVGQRALRGAILAALVLGPLALWRGYTTIAAESSALRCEFLNPARCALSQVRSRPSRAAAVGVLRSIAKVKSYTLRTTYLPPSWRNPYAAKVEKLGIDAYGRVVFPAIAQSLGTRLTDAAAWPSPPYQAATILDLTSVPEFHDLVRFVQTLGALDSEIHVYNAVAPATCDPDEEKLLADFKKLVAGFAPEVSAEPPSSGAESFYSDVLCLATAPTFPHDAEEKRLRYRALDLTATTTHRLFDENVLVEDLDLLQRQIDELARTAPAPSEVYTAYSDLVKSITTTEEDLQRPEIAAGAQSSASLGSVYRRLTDQVAHLDLLGPGVATAMNQQAEDGLKAFKVRLAGYSTDATGALLVQEKGVVKLELAPNILGLRTALQALLQSYAQPRQGEALRTKPLAGTYLAWNAQTLQQAVDLNTNYQAFMGKSFNGFPGFQQIVNQSSRLAVEANVLDLIARGQSFPATPAQSSRELRESFLAAQVDNLSQAAGPLNALLGLLSKPAPAQGCAGSPSLAYCQLGAALRGQRIALGDELDALRVELALYTPVSGAFADWEGSAAENLAWRAFGVKDAAGLASYLTNQRRIVQTLNSRYGVPILSAVPLGTDIGVDSTVALRRWKLIQSDLADYQNKVPENPLLALETYITSGMGTASAANCLAQPAGGNACFGSSTPADQASNPPPCDPFLEIRAGLEARFEPRCAQLNYDAGVAAYARIRSTFDERLANRYPFTAETADATNPAAPADLDAFYAVFDADRAQVENLLLASSRSRNAVPPLPAGPWSAATEEGVGRFLDEMAAVRSFFAVYLDRNVANAAPAAPGAGGAAAPAAPTGGGANANRPRLPSVPAFGLQVAFRPVPVDEQGGNEVILRSVTGDGVALTSTSAPPATPPLWRYGGSLQLLVRWAQDSLAVPQTAGAKAPAQVGERRVTYAFTDPWSLLHLLRALDDPTGPAGRIRLEIPVQAAPAVPGSSQKGAPPVPAPASPAVLFLDFTLTGADGNPAPLAVPTFPTSAPFASGS